MLSRRNIRIKVMQVLYAKNQDKQLKFSEALRSYREGLRHSYELYLLNLLQFMKVKKDATNQSAKLRPTKENLAFRPKLFSNPLSQSFFLDEGLEKYFSAYKVKEKIKLDDCRSLYYDYRKTDQYKAYIANNQCTNKEHQAILLDLFKWLSANELFNENIEDNYLSWTDDKSLVVGAIKKTLKALPVAEEFYKEYLPDSEATVDFGETLLKKVNDDDAKLLAIIEPSLNNWDAERVAVIDMVLLKMAITELTSFPTIPTKVTLNEFVEISKLYSTDKSKDFINGILDRLMKQLDKDGAINKEGRGLKE
jgi:N utilization substance protein B